MDSPKGTQRWVFRKAEKGLPTSDFPITWTN